MVIELRIAEETIEEIRSKTDIVEFISEYVSLTKRGRNWFGLCPFHGENTPSFSVSEDKQIFHCFGCGAGGNAITFLMDIENIPFVEAVAKIGERIGIHVDATPQSQQESTPASKEADRLVEMHKIAANFYHHLLLNTVEGENALSYLKKRGFSKELIEKYGIGWSLSNWDSLSLLLQRNGFGIEEAEKAGLVILRENGEGAFDRFRGRVMFPLHDDHGKVIGFSGRIIDAQDEPKYLNSPETPIFNKGKLLYNLHRARVPIRKNGKIILFEGFMDVIAASKAGIEHGVATMGTSLTPAHIGKIKRLANHVIVSTDGDSAGWEAAKKYSEMLKREGLQTDIAVLPEGLDPDEYIDKFGPQDFADKIIGKPHSFMAFIMMYARRNKNFKFENDLLQYIHEVLEHLVGQSSPVERDLYIRQLSEETKISEEAILQQFRKMEGKIAKLSKNEENSRQSPIQAKIEKKRPLNKVDRAERILLAHMLHNVEIFDRISEESEQPPFFHDPFLAVYFRLAGFYEEYEKADFQRFLETLDDSALRKIVMEASMTERDPDHVEEEIADCLRQIKKYRIELLITEKLQESREAEKLHDHSKALELAKEIINLRKSLSAV